MFDGLLEQYMESDMLGTVGVNCGIADEQVSSILMS